jgi:hypothetical protein
VNAGQSGTGDKPIRRDANRRVIDVYCSVHGGPRGFTNLAVTKRDHLIEMDPHVTAQCLIIFDEKPPPNCSTPLGNGSDEPHSERSPKIPAGRRSSNSPRHAPGARPFHNGAPKTTTGSGAPVTPAGSRRGLAMATTPTRRSPCRTPAWPPRYWVTSGRWRRDPAAALGPIPGVHAGRRAAEADRRGTAEPVADTGRVECPVSPLAHW